MKKTHMSVAEAAVALGVEKSKIYSLLQRGLMRSSPIGRVIRIPNAEIERLASRKSEEEGGISMKELSERLGVHQQTITNAVSRGDIERKRRVFGGGYFIRREVVEALEASDANADAETSAEASAETSAQTSCAS